MKPAAQCRVELRPRAALGVTEAEGLVGVHHFCFSTYQRTDRLEWGDLRALHYYVLSPGHRRNPTFHAGFEIVTLVESGQLRRLGTFAAREPMEAGSVEVISPGMGSTLGVEAIGNEAARYIEIWIRSGEAGVRSGRQFTKLPEAGLKRTIATGPEAHPGALSINGNARISRGALRSSSRDLRLEGSDCAYMLVLDGDGDAARLRAHAGDALAIDGPGECRLAASTSADILLIETRKRG
jgi:redox-sensitive bicupin YhaK (pirin superfamily)